jgi:ligand-binding SRPBCC domain-containing protein
MSKKNENSNDSLDRKFINSSVIIAMKIYSFKSTQLIPTDLQTCWDFFSSPENLQKITPPSMEFKITSELEEKAYPGQIISYVVKPLFGIPLNWITEITQVKELDYFIDEQRFGPYKFWHHKHFFRQVQDGVEMNDLVHYGLPFGFAGRVARFIVEKKLKSIFEYRSGVINTIFIR